MVDVFSKAKRSEIMSRVKNRRTGPEEVVGQILHELNIHYIRNVKSLPGQPDFVVHKSKAAIFVHGCFWHGHSNCNRGKLPSTNRDFWEVKIYGNKLRDARNMRKLRKDGWRVLTIWQCRLRKREQVLKRLRRELNATE